jgi:carboxyl-terminal processing protease
MRSLALLRTGWLLLILGLFSQAPALGFLGEPASTTNPETRAIDGDPDGTLLRGQEYERKHNWTAAIHVYRDAKLKWPSRSDFGQRLRLVEMHQRLVRRYQDISFQKILLRLPRDKAFDLFDELIERIESHYVDSVKLEPLIRRGYDNLEVALRDPNFSFLEMNAPTRTADRVTWLRDQFRARREHLGTLDREAARDELIFACDLAARALAMEPAPVILEFIFGCCDALPDDYTAYLTPDKLEDMFATIDGTFVGLGVELKTDDEGLKLVGVIRGGPAFEAGLKSGDRIVAIAGKSVKGLGLDEAAGRLQGSAGTSVDISVLKVDASTKVYRLVRRQVDVESVARAEIVEELSGVGYIQLTGFQKSSAEELDRAIYKLKLKGMRYLVLDLRGNPGGLLNVSVEIADRFVDQGVIVSTRGRAAGQTQVYRAKPDKPYAMPMAILIDRDSASASEILAGALQELGRAIVIGDRSYGKGSVQSIFPLQSAPAGLKLTTAKFYSPKNRPYSEQGVTPDIKSQIVAKPVADNKGEDQPQEFGDPTTDRVLGLAIQQARRQLTVNR